MGGLSSLFQGTSPPGVTSYNSNVTNVPSWMQNSANSVLSQANAVAGQPYQSFPGPQVAPWTADQNAAQQEVEGMQGAYNPYLNTAATMATGSANPAAFNSAYGYLPQAAGAIQSGMTPGLAQMNPYINDVIQNAQTQTQQYWQNQLQPSIQNQFTQAGQYGSSADLLAQNLASNQLATSLQSQSQAALAGGYTAAQQAGLAGGQALGTLGQLQGGLGYEQGILGLQGAGQLGTLAQLGQNMGLQGAGTLYNIGQQQQQQGQSNLNAAYNNWYNQTYYPQNQLSWLSGLISGTASPYTTGVAQTGTNAGYLPGSTYGPSPVNSAIGLYSGLSGMS